MEKIRTSKRRRAEQQQNRQHAIFTASLPRKEMKVGDQKVRGKGYERKRKGREMGGDGEKRGEGNRRERSRAAVGIPMGIGMGWVWG